MLTTRRVRRPIAERLGLSPVVLFLALAAAWLVLVTAMMIGFSATA